jgi:hypothetical protein
MRLIARCDPANPQAWRRDPMHAALRGYAARPWGTGKLVIAVAGRQAWVITPGPTWRSGKWTRTLPSVWSISSLFVLDTDFEM